MLTTVPFYEIPRDEDGRPSREYDRLFCMALRWWPEVAIPEGMAAAISRKQGGDPKHAGPVALHTLNQGNPISKRQLDCALHWLDAAVDYYEAIEVEPYPGRNEEAAQDMRNLREALD